MDGRKKGGGGLAGERYACGGTQPRPKAVPLVPLVTARRLAGLGVADLSAHHAALLAMDPMTGTALGRLMWVYRRDGRRQRRMMPNGEPVITDQMAAGADIFRAAWVAWSRAEGLPTRTAGAMRLGPSAPSAPPPTDAQAGDAVARWREITAAVKACPSPRMVWAALDAVVIDDTLNRCFRLEDLRCGLVAVAKT